MGKTGPFVVLMSVSAACANAGAENAVGTEVASVKQPLYDVVEATWWGDDSQCISAQADKTFRTQGGKAGIGREYDATAPENPTTGKPGCDGAYIVDYVMPEPGTNGVDGWNWAYIHASHQGEICGALWHNQKVYAYGKRASGEAFEELREEFSWRWDQEQCNTQFINGLPPVVVIGAGYERIRLVTQMGFDDSPGLSQLAYFQTADGDLPDDAPGGFRADPASE